MYRVTELVQFLSLLFSTEMAGLIKWKKKLFLEKKFGKVIADPQMPEKVNMGYTAVLNDDYDRPFNDKM